MKKIGTHSFQFTVDRKRFGAVLNLPAVHQVLLLLLFFLSQFNSFKLFKRMQIRPQAVRQIERRPWNLITGKIHRRGKKGLCRCMQTSLTARSEEIRLYSQDTSTQVVKHQSPALPNFSLLLVIIIFHFFSICYFPLSSSFSFSFLHFFPFVSGMFTAREWSADFITNSFLLFRSLYERSGQDEVCIQKSNVLTAFFLPSSCVH